MMKFENSCRCIVDYDVLEKAISEECRRRGFEPKDHYKIYLYRGYAGISIKHDKVSVHRIIGKYMVGYDFGCVMDSAKKIIKELAEEYKPCTKSCTDCEAYDLVKHNCPKFCKVIKETVEEVKENYNNGWIPCSERLPSESERWLGKDITDAEPRKFIVMVKGAYEPTTGYYTPDGWVKDIYDKERCGYANEIIAWRFFPQPYKEGSRENEQIN